MPIRLSSSSRRWRLASLAGVALACTVSAQAGVVIATYSRLTDPPPDTLYRFNGGPFEQASSQFLGSGAYSRVSAVDNRRSRLPSLLTGEPEFTDVTDASGVHVSTVAGHDIRARASLQPQPSPFFGTATAHAMSSPYQNHARAGTVHQLSFRNSQPVTSGGDTYPADYFYQEDRRTAQAGSGWYETWSAGAAGRVDIDLALDGQMVRDPFCVPNAVCGVSLPPGTDVFRSDQAYTSLDALFIVFDLDQLAYCPEDLYDDCGPSDVGHPVPLSWLTARFQGHDKLPVDLDGQWTLSFDAAAGHRYLVMGLLEVEAQNGGVADFFNTLRVAGVDVARGVLREDSSGRDLADVFTSDPAPVPLPATAWLVAVALAGLRRSVARSGARV